VRVGLEPSLAVASSSRWLYVYAQLPESGFAWPDTAGSVCEYAVTFDAESYE
jgi:hypothetical protein